MIPSIRSSPRTVDTALPSTSCLQRSPSKAPPLPKAHSQIPATATNLQQCALHQIRYLNARNDTAFSPEAQDALDDGFLLCDLAVIRRKLTAWYVMFPRIKPFYALKCNPDPMVASILGRAEDECGFDCASLAEIQLALESSGGSFRRCLYANPQRNIADLIHALKQQVGAMTFDGREELHKIQSAYKSLLGTADEVDTPEVILRLLVPDAHSAVPLGEKFGVPPGQIEILAREACELGLPLVGVSFHCGSGCHDPSAYEVAIRLAKEALGVVNGVLSEFGREDCVLLDIGGGFPGMDGAGADFGRFSGLPTPPQEGRVRSEPTETFDEMTTNDIAKVVTPLINELFPPQEKHQFSIISEPGRYFVEEAFALCSRIYSTRVDEHPGETTTMHYYIAQGVHGVFKDVLLCGEEFLPIALPVDNDRDKIMQDNMELFPSIVHGPSGEDFDVVCKECKLPLLQEGDWLIFDRMGAYTLSIAAKSGKLPIQYVVGGKGE